MGVQDLRELRIGNKVRNIITNEEYQIIMKFQYSVNCFLGSNPVKGHIRIGKINMADFELLEK